MSPVSREQVEQIKGEIRTVLGKDTSDLFILRIYAILEDWIAGKHTAILACEKVQKLMSLFIDEAKARDIGSCFAPIVMRETAPAKK